MRFAIPAAFAIGILLPTPAMLITWSGVSFMMLLSTVSQIERQIVGDLEPRAGVVLAFKLGLLLVCVLALRASVRDLARGDSR
jgi:hypothetical protein